MGSLPWEGTSFVGLTTPSGLGHPPACRGEGQEPWDVWGPGALPWHRPLARHLSALLEWGYDELLARWLYAGLPEGSPAGEVCCH